MRGKVPSSRAAKAAMSASSRQKSNTVAFFKMGLFGYGGGMGMLPLIFQTVRDFCLASRYQILIENIPEI